MRLCETVVALAGVLALGAVADRAAWALPPASPPESGTAVSTTPPPPGSTAAPAKTSWRDRMFFGGGVGLGFGDVTFVSIEPLFGVHLTKQIAVGAGLLYRWTEDNRYDPDLSTNEYGGRAFAQYFPVPQFYLQAEYEYLDYEYPISPTSTTRTSASSIFAGGGVYRPLGGNAGLFASALYNFSYDDNDITSPYDSPWVIRVGVTAGF
jgi:hypothetical protein